MRIDKFGLGTGLLNLGLGITNVLRDNPLNLYIGLLAMLLGAIAIPLSIHNNEY